MSKQARTGSGSHVQVRELLFQILGIELRTHPTSVLQGIVMSTQACMRHIARGRNSKAGCGHQNMCRE
jgi:hypothetical protein